MPKFGLCPLREREKGGKFRPEHEGRKGRNQIRARDKLNAHTESFYTKMYIITWAGRYYLVKGGQYISHDQGRIKELYGPRAVS